MDFNPHFELKDRHAYMSASKYHWVGYDDEKFDDTFRKALAKQRGTQLHNLARDLIELGVKLPRTQQTMNMYVNDALGYRMKPEQTLFYSYNCFGTADAISFRRGMLRIHDLKTGEIPANMKQLEIYTALFCHEYHMKPSEIEIELRIYQNDEVIPHVPEVDEILHIMERIVTFDKRVDELKAESLV